MRVPSNSCAEPVSVRPTPLAEGFHASVSHGEAFRGDSLQVFGDFGPGKGLQAQPCRRSATLNWFLRRAQGSCLYESILVLLVHLRPDNSRSATGACSRREIV